jgi:hypothetical protein
MTPAPFFVRIVFYSRAFLCAQRFVFASHSEKLAISICAPFFVRIVFSSRAFSLCAAFSLRKPF